MTWEPHVISAAAMFISLGGLIYTVKSKASESYVKTLEYKLNDVILVEKECQRRLTNIEQLNHDLLMRLAGIRPIGRNDP